MSRKDEMNERVHRYLDGELPLSALTPQDAAQARGVEQVAAALRADADGLAEVDLTPAVMNRIVRTEPERRARAGFVEWWLGRRRISFNLRPVYVAAAVALVLAAGLRWDLVPSWADGPAAIAESEPAVFVRFELSAPGARSVELAGSFSDWVPEISLAPVEGGRWIALIPLQPGVHDYAFRVDGERWVVDPSAPRVADGFGGFNSRLSLILSDS